MTEKESLPRRITLIADKAKNGLIAYFGRKTLKNSVLYETAVLGVETIERTSSDVGKNLDNIKEEVCQITFGGLDKDARFQLLVPAEVMDELAAKWQKWRSGKDNVYQYLQIDKANTQDVYEYPMDGISKAIQHFTASVMVGDVDVALRVIREDGQGWKETLRVLAVGNPSGIVAYPDAPPIFKQGAVSEFTVAANVEIPKTLHIPPTP